MRGILASIVSVGFSLAVSIPLSAQASESIVHLGYQSARPMLVAPGQVLHLTLRGLTTVFTATQIAQTVPLPTNFLGLSVSLLRSGTAQSELLPLLRLDLGSTSCDSVSVWSPMRSLVSRTRHL